MKIKDIKDICPIDPEKLRERVISIEEQEYVPEPQYYDYD